MRIERQRCGYRIAAYRDATGGWSTTPDDLFTPDNSRLIRLSLAKSGDDWVEIEMLRHLDWIEESGAQVGGRVVLDMQEMGACGEAKVLAIDPCPPIQSGPGRLVTATFSHTSGEVLELQVEGESKPIPVTGGHLFKSEDRKEFVPAGDLRIGETLKTLTGTARVESITKRPNPEPVYNIEVEGDHVYRVGESGVLVHNASAPCSSNNVAKGDRKIINSTIHQIRHPNVTQTAITYTKVRKVIANLQLTTGSEPDTWMRRLIQEGVLMNLPGNLRLGKTGDHVGHIIGQQFGGPALRDDGGIGNVFPQDGPTNTIAFRIFETKTVAKALNTGACDVCVEIEFDFAPASNLPLRPTKFEYKWWIDGQQQTTMQFNNP